MPPLPPHARLPALARIWVGPVTGRRREASLQQLYAAPGPNKFVYLSDEALRVRGPALTNSCIVECASKPPALFDAAAGLTPTLRANAAAGQLIARAIAPGTTCEDWSLLRPLPLEQCQRLGNFGLKRSLGSMFAGCILWRRAMGMMASFNEPNLTGGHRVGCHLHGSGRHCVCLGPPAQARTPFQVGNVVAHLMRTATGDGGARRRKRCDAAKHSSARWLPMLGLP